MMVRQANPDRMTEAFGLYALSGKGHVLPLAPGLIALATTITADQTPRRHAADPALPDRLALLVWVKPKAKDEAYWTERTAPAVKREPSVAN